MPDQTVEVVHKVLVRGNWFPIAWAFVRAWLRGYDYVSLRTYIRQDQLQITDSADQTRDEP